MQRHQRKKFRNCFLEYYSGNKTVIWVRRMDRFSFEKVDIKVKTIISIQNEIAKWSSFLPSVIRTMEDYKRNYNFSFMPSYVGVGRFEKPYWLPVKPLKKIKYFDCKVILNVKWLLFDSIQYIAIVPKELPQFFSLSYSRTSHSN